MKDIIFQTGCEDFAEIIENGAYYVDKTAYLNEIFIKSPVKNPLFIRPRRFGKTLNLSTIKEFCRLNYQNPKDKSYQLRLFIDNGRKLAVTGDAYKELREKIMGEFPVISISFKTVEGGSFFQAVSQLLYKIGMIYDEFSFLINSSKQDTDDINNFRENKKFCITRANDLYELPNLQKAVSIIGRAIPGIGEMLYKEYGRKVIVIIDEYDVPLQKAVTAEEPYYSKMLDIIRTISGNTFKKDNLPWLYKGIVTGCLRIAHQSVFTDANNFTTYGISDAPYTGFFGFTEAETEKLLQDCELSNKESTVKEWYDGYRFGDKHVFCPWSLINYCAKASLNPGIDPQPFWINTSGNDLITMFAQNSMEAHDAGNVTRLQQLLDGDRVSITLEEFSTYPDIRNRVSFDVFMTMMLHTGYVTFTEDSAFLDKVNIRIPNKEVLSCFRAKQNYLYGENNPYWFNQSLKLVDLLMENNADDAKMLMSTMLKEFLSIRNTGHELYYHGFLTGILGIAASARGFKYHEEIETGTGFSDIIIDNYDTKTVCILELKKAGKLSDCYAAAVSAAKQIIKKDHAAKFLSLRYKKVYGTGIGFAEKSCETAALGNLLESEK